MHTNTMTPDPPDRPGDGSALLPGDLVGCAPLSPAEAVALSADLALIANGPHETELWPVPRQLRRVAS